MAYLGYPAGPNETPGRYIGALPFNTSATGPNTSQVFYYNQTTIAADYTLETNYNALSAGPITINSGVTVTVPSGSSWTVI